MEYDGIDIKLFKRIKRSQAIRNQLHQFTFVAKLAAKHTHFS